MSEGDINLKLSLESDSSECTIQQNAVIQMGGPKGCLEQGRIEDIEQGQQMEHSVIPVCKVTFSEGSLQRSTASTIISWIGLICSVANICAVSLSVKVVGKDAISVACLAV